MRPEELLLQEERWLDQRATFPVRLAVHRQVADQGHPGLEHRVASARQAVLEHPAVVALERRAELVPLQPAVAAAVV